MKTILFTSTSLLAIALASPAKAQNPTCPTRPAGDSTNACASTAFVQTAAASAAISVLAFGAKCNGTFDDTASFTAAFSAAQTKNLLIGIPSGTCIISSNLAMNLTAGTVGILGQGQQSIIKAKDSANLDSMIISQGTNLLEMSNVVLDGNRANGGTRSTTASYGIVIERPFKAQFLEVKNVGWIGVGVFLGPSSVSFDNSYFHDIGPVSSSGNNIAVGIFVGETMPVVTSLSVTNSRFEDIHSTVTAIGDSSAINAAIINSIISNNRFKNNYNVNGGQIAITDGGTGAGVSNTSVQGNVIIQTARFDGDLTAGIEINASNVTISGNLCQGTASDCIRIEAASSGIIIEGNNCDNYGTATPSGCVNMINNVTKTTVRNNFARNGYYGFLVQNGALARNNVLGPNDVDATVTQPIAGVWTVAGFVDAVGNVGYGTDLPGSTSAFPCPYPCVDIGGVLVMNASQQTYYAIGDFAGFAAFQQAGVHSPAWAFTLLKNTAFQLIYDANSFCVNPPSCTVVNVDAAPITWSDKWTYIATNTNGTLPNYLDSGPNAFHYGAGLALGWNYLTTGELYFANNNFLNGAASLDYVFSHANSDGSVLTPLMWIAAPSNTQGNTNGSWVLIGPQLPNFSQAGRLNVNAGSQASMAVLASAVSNTAISTYPMGPTIISQLLDNTNNNTAAFEWRAANTDKNSFAAIVAQKTASTASTVTGNMSFLVANAGGSASLALTINPSGGAYVGGTASDPGANNFGVQGIYKVGATSGVSCSGAPTAGFTSVGGIVTAC